MLPRTVLALLIAAWPAMAAAQQSPKPQAEASKPEHLTSRGRLLLSGGVGGYWSNDRPSSYGSYGKWAFYAHPSVLYFVRDRVGLGVSIGGGTSETETLLYVLRDHDVGLGGLALFDLPLGRSMSLFFEPRVAYFEQWLDRSLTRLGRQLPQYVGGDPGFGAQGATFQQQSFGSLSYQPDRRRFLRFSLSVPLVFHVSDRVGLGLGPDLWFDIMLGNDRYLRTQVGASTNIYASF